MEIQCRNISKFNSFHVFTSIDTLHEINVTQNYRDIHNISNTFH